MPAPPYSDLAFYASLGLKCGLEVHRQLDTGHKLFCDCPVRPYKPDYDSEILRHMRPTLSELGVYDPTALMEFKTRKQIIYRLNRETVCTYEMDDAPPFRLNRDALHRALVIATMLNLNLVDELHIARKQYLDGSIPTGFQRTLILGVNGFFLCNGRRIGVRQLGLEEEACREVSDQGHTRTYMTDRLSIPLIEVVTEAQARTPAESADLAHVIRKICHLSGMVRTGLGRVRQDVNVSVEGGERVEIKGVPRIRQIPALVHFEALRQKALLDVRDQARDRGLTPKAFSDSVDVSREARESSNPVFADWLAQGGVARAVILRGCSGLLTHSLGPDRTFAAEIADRVRVVACLDRMPNMIHSAEPGGDRLVETARSQAAAGPEDAVVCVAGPAEDVDTAMGEVRLRMEEALVGVPRETRRALESGITVFERLLPGPDRMYPDTDLPPIALDAEDFDGASDDAPADSLWDKEETYRESGLSPAQVDRLFTTDMFRLYDEVAERVSLRLSILAYLLVDYRVGLRRAGVDVERLDADLLVGLFGSESCTDLKQKDAANGLKKALTGSE